MMASTSWIQDFLSDLKMQQFYTVDIFDVICNIKNNIHIFFSQNKIYVTFTLHHLCLGKKSKLCSKDTFSKGNVWCHSSMVFFPIVSTDRKLMSISQVCGQVDSPASTHQGLLHIVRFLQFLSHFYNLVFGTFTSWWYLLQTWKNLSISKYKAEKPKQIHIMSWKSKNNEIDIECNSGCIKHDDFEEKQILFPAVSPFIYQLSMAGKTFVFSQNTMTCKNTP